ncbi:MAG: sigma-70 family RNA polymerase sigma factor [Myxococcota bacterium]
MDAGAGLAYFEVATVGLLMVVVTPVLLAMGAAAFAPMIAAVKRVALGLGRRPVRAVTERAASFDHLPRELATMGRDTLALLEELDHFSQAATPVSTSQTPRWWNRIGAAFADASAYQAETRTAHEVWQWVFAAERLPTDRLEDLRALGIDPNRVRAELLSSTCLRTRLPALLGELERITDALAGYAGTDYRGRPLGRPPLPVDATADPSSSPKTEDLRPKRYREIERRHGRLLQRIAARHTQTPADRDDLLQEIRLAIWNALPAYRGESSLRTYAVRIAHNRAATALRRTPAPPTDVPELPASQPDFDQQLETATRRGWLTRALAQLSPGIADALQRRLAGDSYQEIADALGITTSNVGVRLHTGKAKLQALAAEER